MTPTCPAGRNSKWLAPVLLERYANGLASVEDFRGSEDVHSGSLKKKKKEEKKEEKKKKKKKRET